MNKVVAVTGGAGFVGKLLCLELLNRGYRVVALDLVDPEIVGVDFFHFDISKSISTENLNIPDGSAFVHLAAVSTDPLCKSDPIGAININLTGTARVIEAAANINCSKFVFASSEWVYPDSTKAILQQEDQKLGLEDLNSLYAMTKLMGESIVRTICTIPYTILRFGIVYGPRKIAGSAPESIAFKIAQGQDVTIGSGGTARRFIYVDDLISGICLAVAESPLPTNETYNLAGSAIVDLNEIAKTALGITQSKAKVIDQKLTPSIRNPEPSKFNSHFNFSAQTSLSRGLELCLEVMNPKN